MANTIKEYSAGVNLDGSTYEITTSSVFTTPDYLQGRGETDIKVYVDDSLKVHDVDYVFVNTGSISFKTGRLPYEGSKITIKRNSNQDSRLTDYANGSLLRAEVLDNDANQIFNMAQEALDKAEQTKIGTETFYYKQDTAPTDVVSGTLWFDTGSSPNSLMVYNGTEWHSTAPVVDEKHYTIDDSGVLVRPTDTPPQVWFPTPIITAEREIYLNGVKLKGEIAPFSTDKTAQFTAGLIDYMVFRLNPADTTEYLIVAGTFTSDDMITVKTSHGGYAETVTQSEANVKAIEQNIIDSTNLAANYAGADEDVSFDDDGVAAYSAKHFSAKAEGHKTDTDALISGFDAHVVGAKAGATATIDQKSTEEQSDIQFFADAQKSRLTEIYYGEILDLNAIHHATDLAKYQIESLASNNQLFAEGEVDTPFIVDGQAHYSAKHYAKVAQDAANVSVDKLAGWTTIDSEVITTYGTDDPEIISTTSFAITAPEGVKVNDFNLPMSVGVYDLLSNSGGSYSTWQGSSNITISHGYRNEVDLVFATPFSSVDDYYVVASYSGSTKGIVKIEKATNQVNIEVHQEGGTNNIFTGEVAVQVYKLT